MSEIHTPTHQGMVAIVHDAFADQLAQAADAVRQGFDDKLNSYLPFWDEFKTFCEKLRAYNLADFDLCSTPDFEYFATGLSNEIELKEIADHLFNVEVIDLLPRLEAALQKNLTETQLLEMKTEKQSCILTTSCSLVSLSDLKLNSQKELSLRFVFQDTSAQKKHGQANKTAIMTKDSD